MGFIVGSDGEGATLSSQSIGTRGSPTHGVEQRARRTGVQGPTQRESPAGVQGFRPLAAGGAFTLDRGKQRVFLCGAALRLPHQERVPSSSRGRAEGSSQLNLPKAGVRCFQPAVTNRRHPSSDHALPQSLQGVPPDPAVRRRGMIQAAADARGSQTPSRTDTSLVHDDVSSQYVPAPHTSH